MLRYIDGVGIGTIIGALFTGIFINNICDYLENRYIFEPIIPLVRKILDRNQITIDRKQ
jgi:hypothetical protein